MKFLSDRMTIKIFYIKDSSQKIINSKDEIDFYKNVQRNTG